MKKKGLNSGHYLIVQADFYAELAAAQKQGAVAELETAGASYDVISAVSYTHLTLPTIE